MLLRSFILLALLAWLPFSCTARQADPEVSAQLDRFFQNLETHDMALGNITLAMHGQPVYQRAFGFSGLHDGERIPATEHTRYRVGSVSKTFTAVLIAQLMQEGLISADTPLSNFYPQLPNADRITVEHLLQHRSGLFNFTNDPEYVSWMETGKSRDELLIFFEGLATEFEPGTAYDYSNTGYVLLGFILEDVTMKSYAELVQERIAGPLELLNTYAGTDNVIAAGEAESFIKITEWQRAPVTDMRVPGAAGAIISTPYDLTQFIDGLFSGRLLSAEMLETMTDLNEGYGYGITQIPFYDIRMLGHGGNIDGFQSVLAYDPNTGFSIALITNGAAYPQNDIAIGVLSIWNEKEYEMPDFSPKSGPDNPDQYTGTYSSEALPMQITVTFHNGQLLAQATGQAAFPLELVADHTFRFVPAGIEMQFDPEQNTMLLLQGGGQFLFKKN